MKVEIDLRLCQGHGQCQDSAPSVFEVCDDRFAYLLVDEIPAEDEAKVRDAAGRCSVNTVRLTLRIDAAATAQMRMLPQDVRDFRSQPWARSHPHGGHGRSTCQRAPLPGGMLVQMQIQAVNAARKQRGYFRLQTLTDDV